MTIHSYKVHQSERIRREIDAYLARGGQIHQVPAGQSGGPESSSHRGRPFLPSPPRQERTQVPHVIAAIEARKRPENVRLKKKPRQPGKRYIYDDFGEVIRWEWET